MYSLLIVDDEPDIVEGIYSVCRFIQNIDVDIMKAYSGFEALDILQKHKMDIIISDIIMPGMNGLELLEKTRKIWPSSKFIFLTGHKDFEYVYTAIKYDSVDYLIKNGEFSDVIVAVEKMIDVIEKESLNDEVIAEAQSNISKAQYAMQKDLLNELIISDKRIDDSYRKRFYALKMPIDPDDKGLLFLVRTTLTEEDQNHDQPDYNKIYLNVSQLIPNYLSYFETLIDRNMLLWIIQPKKETGQKKMPWEEIVMVVKGVAESLQDLYESKNNYKLAVVVDIEGTKFENLSSKLDYLKFLMYSKLGFDQGILLTGQHDNTSKNNESRKLQNRIIQHLELILDNGQQNEFDKLTSDIRSYYLDENNNDFTSMMEIFYSLSIVFLSYINRRGMVEELSNKIELGKLTQFNKHISFPEMLAYFQSLAGYVFKFQKSGSFKNEINAIVAVKNYIHNNIDSDLSLSVLAEQVFYNPTYLSRLFKNTTGMNLLNYINNIRLKKSKELLKNNDLKINEIAKAVGYPNATYFAYFFKKYTNLSPHEYRNTMIDSSLQS